MLNYKIISSTNSNVPFIVQGEFRYWKDLRNEIENVHGINCRNMSVRIKETRNLLDMGNAVLPDFDCTLYLTVKKTKGAVALTTTQIKELRTKFNNIMDKIEESLNNYDENLIIDFENYLDELEEEGLS